MNELRWPLRGSVRTIEGVLWLAPFAFALFALDRGGPTPADSPPSACRACPACGACGARLRPLDALSRALVSEGTSRSPTFARLVADLDRGNTIVYVTTRARDLTSRGALRFMAHASSLTYTLACVDPGQTNDERIAVLAHELRHATEVAASSSPITSSADFRQLYRHIGFEYRNGNRFESEPALMSQALVRRELAHGATTPGR